MARKRKQKLGVWGWIGVIAVALVALSLLGVNFLSLGDSPLSAVTGDDTCFNVEETDLTLSAFDKFNPGTTVGATTYVSLNGGKYKTGVTKASPGDSISVLFVNGSDFHAAVTEEEPVPCKGTFEIETGVYENASLTLSVFNTDGDKMTDGGGATNQTVAAGGTYNMKLRIDGEDEASTQDMIAVLETSDKTKAEKIVLTGFGASEGGVLPEIYSLAGTSSQTWVYEVAAVEGAVSPEGVIQIQSESGQSLTGDYFKLTLYPKEHFINNDGGISFDVENEDGTAKNIASYTFTGYFT